MDFPSLTSHTDLLQIYLVFRCHIFLALELYFQGFYVFWWNHWNVWWRCFYVWKENTCLFYWCYRELNLSYRIFTSSRPWKIWCLFIFFKIFSIHGITNVRESWIGEVGTGSRIFIFPCGNKWPCYMHFFPSISKCSSSLWMLLEFWFFVVGSGRWRLWITE